MTALCVAPRASHAQAVTYVSDPLTAAPSSGAAPGVTAGARGGTFGPTGWTTTGDTDTVWYAIPATLPRGRVEVSIRGLSIAGSLRGQEHDLIGIYGATDRAEPVAYNPWYRNNEFKVLVRIFGDLNRCDGCQAVGASKLELAMCPALTPEGFIETMCPAACVAAGFDFWQAYLGPRGRGEELPWDAATDYRFVITWEPGRMTYSRGGPEGSSSLTFPGTYAPRALRVRLGPPSSERGPDTAMPRGITFSNLLVQGEPGAPTASCAGAAVPDAGSPPIDASGACGSNPIRVGGFEPASGRGPAQVFRATYRHCGGAGAFRVAQVWVGERVDPALPHFAAGFEAGRFFLDASQSCAPGEARTLANRYGALDCARSRATNSGDDLVVEWALAFDPPAFAGERGVFVDAKGPAGPSEPRLGWTRVGTFTVAPDGTPGDGGADAAFDAARDARGPGGTNPPEGGCGCRAPGHADHGDTSRHFWVILGGLVAVARRRRAPADSP